MPVHSQREGRIVGLGWNRLGHFLLVAALGLCPSLAFGAIVWNLTYLDVVNNTSFGFDDPTLGATRQTTFQSVLSYVNTVVNESGTVDIEVQQSSNLPGASTLASAGSLFFTSPNGFQDGLVFTHATTGVDPAGGVEDGVATFNFGKTWNSELDAPTGSEFDLFTVALHELTHAMGFSSLLESDGTSGISGGDPGVFSTFDTFLERGDGTPLFNGGAGDYTGTAGDLTSNDVFFGGPNATAANGGNPVPIYSPATFNNGSSISHITTAGAVMNFSVAPGVTKRAYLPAEIGILQDIGWTLSAASGAVPEPSTTLLLAVAALTIRGLRNRRDRTAPPDAEANPTATRLGRRGTRY